MIGISLVQAHLFDIDAVPEAIDLVLHGRIDRFKNLEAVVQWSIHDNSFRDYACARVSCARYIAAPWLSRKLVVVILVDRDEPRSVTRSNEMP
jgi:hypothetical protein